MVPAKTGVGGERKKVQEERASPLFFLKKISALSKDSAISITKERSLMR